MTDLQQEVPAGAHVEAKSAQGVSLYVGDLANDVTEAVLFEKFNPIGAVASIRVCRDAISRRSLGYAYVNFNTPKDASKAMDQMNFEEINGKACRIMWCQRDPSVRRSGVGNIFIKNLNKAVIDNKTLYDTFEQFGTILSCKVVTDPSGLSRGFGFVHYNCQEAADKAIENVNGMLLAEQQVFVGPFKTRRERLEEYGKTEKQFTNVYCKNLPKSLNEEAFEKLFAAFGTVTSRKLMTKDGESLGFGFVAFENPEDAKKAVDEMNEKEIEGQKLYVARAQKKAERVAFLRRQFEAKRQVMQSKYKGVNLFVKNLADNINDDELRKAFADMGNITSVKVMTDERGISKGFGFVCFSSPEEATKAVTEMNGFILFNKPLYVALAQRKEERKQQLAMQHSQRLNMRMQMPPGGMYPPNQASLMYMQQMPYARYPQMQRPPRYGMPQAAPNTMMMPPRPVQQGLVRAPAGRGQMKNNRPPTQAQFRHGARNIPQQVPPMHQGQEPLDASALAHAPEPQQKQMLGERLYPQIQQIHPELAGKITGMLLEMDNSELLHLLEDASALSSKVQEAVAVLKEHAANTGSTIPGL